MRTIYHFFIGMTVIFISFLTGCNDDPSGTLVFEGVENMMNEKSFVANPSLLDISASQNEYVLHPTGLKFSVAEIWVSQDLVEEGVNDNFKWYKVGESNGLKFTHEYKFQKSGLPVGEYRSLKFVFRDQFSYMAVFQNDLNRKIEIQTSFSEGACGNPNTLNIDYFSSRGNHSLVGGTFHLDSRGERIRGFKIKEGEKTYVFWGLGNSGMDITDCWSTWTDVNNNNQWDCGVDQLSGFECKQMAQMFYFSVDDGEEDPGWDDEEEEEEEPKIKVDTNYMVTDIAGNRYKAVKIGEQVWMAENLKTPRLNDSTLIVNNPEASAWEWAGGTGKIPSQCVYNNDVDFLRQYGRFYNYHVVATGKICPKGWHVPTRDEWQKLIDYVAEAGTLKVSSTSFWNGHGNNESYFSALPAGFRNFQGNFHEILEGGFWWSSTPRGTDQAYYFYLPGLVTYHSPMENNERGQLGGGMSIRCVKD